MVKIKKNIERFYDGICDVFEEQKVINKNQSTGFKEVCLLEKIPCHLSFVTSNSANKAKNITISNQIIKLFLAPDVIINPGAKIIVTQNNIKKEYANSGTSSVYQTHQEIVLELFDKYS